MQDTTDSRVPKRSRALTKVGGSPPMFKETRLVSGKKSDIFVEWASASMKHDTPFNISIISSQFGGTAVAGLIFSSEASLSTAASGPPSVPRASYSDGTLLGVATSGCATAVALGSATSGWVTVAALGPTTSGWVVATTLGPTTSG